MTSRMGTGRGAGYVYGWDRDSPAHDPGQFRRKLARVLDDGDTVDIVSVEDAHDARYPEPDAADGAGVEVYRCGADSGPVIPVDADHAKHCDLGAECPLCAVLRGDARDAATWRAWRLRRAA